MWIPVFVGLLAMFILYLGMACSTPLIFPRFLPASSNWFKVCRCGRNNSRRPRRARRGKPGKARGIINEVVCCGLTLLYVAVFVAAIGGAIIFANIRRRNLNDVYLVKDTWAGTYVVLDTSSNASSGSLYSSDRANLGQLLFTTISGGWTVEFPESQQGIEKIIYANAIRDPRDYDSVYTPIRFNASCNPFSNSNSSDICLTGGLIRQPAPYNGSSDCNSDQVCRPNPDFSGDITVFLRSPNPIPTLNITSNVNVVTSADAYQGIGKHFAPLGYWYFNNVPIVQVAWPYLGPCDGLQVFLSKEYEGISWSVLGLVWQWWRSWGEAAQDIDVLSSTVCDWPT